MAHYYFEEGNYPKSLEWFDKADSNNMSQTERKNNFKKDTLILQLKTKEATKYFNQVVNSKLLEVKQNIIWGICLTRLTIIKVQINILNKFLIKTSIKKKWVIFKRT